MAITTYYIALAAVIIAACDLVSHLSWRFFNDLAQINAGNSEQA
jgi:hypothetical protein